MNIQLAISQAGGHFPTELHGKITISVSVAPRARKDQIGVITAATFAATIRPIMLITILGVVLVKTLMAPFAVVNLCQAIGLNCPAFLIPADT
jgi:hypothetical protein